MSDLIKRENCFVVEIEPAITKLKWFCIDQNNSGGSFVVDENVSHYVFVQAPTAREAESRIERHLDNSDSCPCCGDRWSLWLSDDSGTDRPEIYGTPIEDYRDRWVEDFARLHYYDGRVEAYPIIERKKLK